MESLAQNHIVLDAVVLELAALRYTPSNLPVLEFKVSHESWQTEVGVERLVQCLVPCITLGDTAVLLNNVRLGTVLRLKGFLAQRSTQNKTIMLHAITIEFIER